MFMHPVVCVNIKKYRAINLEWQKTRSEVFLRRAFHKNRNSVFHACTLNTKDQRFIKYAEQSILREKR